MEVTSLPSADSTTTRKRTRRTSAVGAGDVTDPAQQNVPNKRRGRDMGNLMPHNGIGETDLCETYRAT